MALYRITVKRRVVSSGMCIEPGMEVNVSSLMPTNPISINGGKSVAEAFMRIYGVDLKKMGVLNIGYLEATRIG